MYKGAGNGGEIDHKKLGDNLPPRKRLNREKTLEIYNKTKRKIEWPVLVNLLKKF